MLPEKLSTNLTSLGEGAERLAIVMEMVVAADGTVTASEPLPGRGHESRQARLQQRCGLARRRGARPAEACGGARTRSQIRMQDRAAQALKRMRHARGALRLETLEVRAVFDATGLADLRPDPKNRAKELIEDLMIAANGVTARYLEKKGLPSVRRVLKTPKRWDRIVALASESGERLAAGARRRCAGCVPGETPRGRPAAFFRRFALRREAAGLG
jgi:exoribonuclease-2